MREILLPIVVAILFDFLLSPSVRFLQKFYIPRALGSAIVIFLVLSILGLGCYFLAEPAREWMKKGPEAMDILDNKIALVNNTISKPINSASQIFTKISTLNHAQAPKPASGMLGSPFEFFAALFTITEKFLAEVSVMIILLYFLLTKDDFILRKIVTSQSSLEMKKEAVMITREIQDRVWKYLFSRTAINVVLAIFSSIVLAILGVPNPILWGVLFGILDFVPYIGGLLSIFIIAIVSFITFSNMLYASMVPLIFCVVFFIEGNLIAPYVIGRFVTLNPIMVFLSLIFWSWIWGPVGALISIPIMVTIKIFFEALHRESFIYELLAE